MYAPPSLKFGGNVTRATAPCGLIFHYQDLSNAHTSVTLFPNPTYTEQA